jgi:hypothetical protein
MLCTGLMHTLYLIWRNFTFQVPSFDVTFLAKGCRPCVRHSSGSRVLSKHDRQCNVAWTAIHTTGDKLHSCWWHDNDVYVSCHWLAPWTLAMLLGTDYSAVELSELNTHIFHWKWIFIRMHVQMGMHKKMYWYTSTHTSRELYVQCKGRQLERFNT